MPVPTDPYNFVNGTTADGDQVDARFLPLYTALNGALDNTNLASNAVTTAKITDASVTAPKIGGQAYTRAYHNATQSLTTGVTAALSFNTLRYERVDDMYDAAAVSRLTARRAGLYAIGAHVNIASGGGGGRAVYLRKNGTDYLARQFVHTGGTNDWMASISTEVELAVNDYVEALAYQASGASINVNASTATEQGNADFWMRYVSP